MTTKYIVRVSSLRSFGSVSESVFNTYAEADASAQSAADNGYEVEVVERDIPELTFKAWVGEMIATGRAYDWQAHQLEFGIKCYSIVVFDFDSCDDEGINLVGEFECTLETAPFREVVSANDFCTAMNR